MDDPILSIEEDMREFVWIFIKESQKANEFYVTELSLLQEWFDSYYKIQFLAKILETNTDIERNNELKANSVDSLGYASSWARPII